MAADPISKPKAFKKAVSSLRGRKVIKRSLTSAEWQNVPVEIRQRAFFAANIENARFLSKAKSLIQEQIRRQARGERVKRADFVRKMTGLFDISESRLKLIFDVNTQQARAYGFWKESQNPRVAEAFPAQKFFRRYRKKEPRPLHEANKGVIKRKDDIPFWLAMNDPAIGGFGVPYGPWGFNSGMDVKDISRRYAERIGLVKKGEKVVPAEGKFNQHLEASGEKIDQEMLTKLRERLGQTMSLEGDKIKYIEAIPKTTRQRMAR